MYIRALLQRPRCKAQVETPVPSRKSQRRTTVCILITKTFFYFFTKFQLKLNTLTATPKKMMMIGSSWTGTGLREARAQLQEGTTKNKIKNLENLQICFYSHYEI